MTRRYLLGMSDSIFPSVLVGPLQQVMHLLPESRHRKLASIADNLKHQFLDLLGTNGVFLYPTFPTTAHRHYQIYHKLVDTGYMMVFNTIGLPVTNCMVRLDRHKLPIGIQVRRCVWSGHLQAKQFRFISLGRCESWTRSFSACRCTGDRREIRRMGATTSRTRINTHAHNEQELYCKWK